MIDSIMAKRIEYEILGCHLNNLSLNMLREVIGTTDLQGWREQAPDAEGNYQDYIKGLFRRTKDHFDWEAVVQQVINEITKLPEVSTPEMPPVESPKEEFTGDPLDLRFLAFAKKVNKLILEQKSPVYKDSWRKRGLVGIYHNLCRKWDRIENIFEDEELSGGRELNVELLPTGDESIVETIADLFAYTGKCMTYFEYEPRYRVMLNQWMVRNGLENGKEEPDE